MTNLSLKEFGEKYVQKGFEATKQQDEWYKGKTTIKKNSVYRIAKKLRGSEHIYNLPLWRLLDHRAKSRSKLKKLIDPYTWDGPLGDTWTFPNDINKLGRDNLTPRHSPWFSIDEEKLKELDGYYDWIFPIWSRRFKLYAVLPPILMKEDSKGLYERGDIFGFIGNLALVRQAEITGDIDNLYFHLLYLYASLPALGRISIFKDVWEDILDIIIEIQCNYLTITGLLWPNREMMKRQVKSKDHFTQRSLRPRVMKTGQYRELPLPVKVTRGMPFSDSASS